MPGGRGGAVRALAPALVGWLLAAACLPGRPFDEAAWRQTVEATRAEALYAPHRDPATGRFFNPWLPQDRSGWEFWRWKLSVNALAGRAADPPATPVAPNDGAYLADPEAPPSLTHVGHATFALHWGRAGGGQLVLTDPFFGERALVPRRRVPPAFDPEVIPAGSVVLVSHNHYDHLDAGSVGALGERAVFLCPLGLGDLLRRYGAREVRELDWWDEAEVGGTRFVFLPAQHWSRRLGQGRNETLWGSWLIERAGVRVYFGADSGYFVGYREFGRRFPGIRVALLPIGAYEPRWFMHYAHTDPAEALRAFRDLGAELLVPIQWGVLDLGDEPAAWPLVTLEEARAAEPDLRDRVRVLPVGGRLELDPGAAAGPGR